MQKGSIDEKSRGIWIWMDWMDGDPRIWNELEPFEALKWHAACFMVAWVEWTGIRESFRHKLVACVDLLTEGCWVEYFAGLFESLGQWLARFVIELNEYLPVKVEYVEAKAFCGVRVLSGFDKQLRCQILQWDTGVAWTKHGVITNCHSYRKDTSGLNLIWIMLFSSCLRLVAKSRMAQLERLWWMRVVVPSLEWRHCLFVRLSFRRLSVLLSVRLAVSSFLCFPPFLDATFKDN